MKPEVNSSLNFLRAAEGSGVGEETGVVDDCSTWSSEVAGLRIETEEGSKAYPPSRPFSSLSFFFSFSFLWSRLDYLAVSLNMHNTG